MQFVFFTGDRGALPDNKTMGCLMLRRNQLGYSCCQLTITLVQQLMALSTLLSLKLDAHSEQKS